MMKTVLIRGFNQIYFGLRRFLAEETEVRAYAIVTVRRGVIIAAYPRANLGWKALPAPI
jgi:hypothetical protein